MLTKRKGIGGHHHPHEGISNDWLTPPDLLAELGHFDLDPCASVAQPWATADRMLTEGGLDANWSGMVWLNPPYGPHVGEWLAKLADHGNGMALIFARTETRAFHEYVWSKASAVFFLEGRLHFCRPVTGEQMKANAGAPNVLIAYGAVADRRLEVLKGGKYLSLRK